MRPVLIAVLAAGMLALSACATGPATPGSAASPDGRPTVVAAFYPLAYAAEQVSGGAVDVISLTPPGVEPHDLELSAAQVAQIADADLVLYVRGFQPAVDEAVDQQAADRAIDVSQAVTPLSTEGAVDPHVWLAPENMAAIGTSIASRFKDLPGTAPSQSATAEFTDEMAVLDGEFAAALAQCRSRDLVVSHEAFGYLARAYDLTQVGISGLSPEAEPSPARLKEVADLVSRQGVSTIYYETLVSPAVAETLAAETGAQTAVLDPLEGLAEGSNGDYASIMRENLATLVEGQGCA